MAKIVEFNAPAKSGPTPLGILRNNGGADGVLPTGEEIGLS